MLIERATKGVPDILFHIVGKNRALTDIGIKKLSNLIAWSYILSCRHFLMKSKSGKIPQLVLCGWRSFRYVPQEQSQPILLLQVKAILGKLYFILSLVTI